MTYILAGRLKKSNYLIVDCISTNSKTNKKTFVDKLSKLDSSSDTFYTLTGAPFIDNAIKTYDHWLYINNRNNDFISGGESIINLEKVINKNVLTYEGEYNISLGSNRLFFISKNGVVVYDLDYDSNNKLKKKINKTLLKTNEFIDSILFSEKEFVEFNHNIDIYKMSTEYLSNMAKEINFRERYSFVEINEDGNIINISPFKRYSDYLAMLNEIDYEKIDNEDFKWDI